ncbi:TetR/AcrR family transcriptional regulator [Auraticoccus cholistanensis]|uniref:TetR/AcrR family transcriptional regulator n=1 Tax=Auraticoccus cholistanensis TaxID=2656650 RepID=UPI0018D20A78
MLQAAGELIAELGWGRVSTRLVAERAGVRPGVVHYHFASQQQLLTEAATAVLSGFVSQALVALSELDDVRSGLAGLVGSLAGLGPGQPAHLLFTETYLAASRDEAVAAALSGVLADFRTELTRWLRAGGVPAAEAGDLAALLGAALDGIALHRVLDPALPLHRLADLLGRLVPDDQGGAP